MSDEIPEVTAETIAVNFAPSGERVIRGHFAPGGRITNTGGGRIRLICQNGPDIVVEPGETAEFELKGHRIYRIACNDCGLADGGHETWCPLWQPYVASE